MHQSPPPKRKRPKGMGVMPIPPSRLGNRKRMWEFVHDLTAPDANEELLRVRALAYKRVDRDASESRYLLKWLVPRCPRLAQLDEEHQKKLLVKIEVLQFNDTDIYENTCGVLVRGWMIKQGQRSGKILGPGTCVDCDGTNTKYECWYGADDMAPPEIDRKRKVASKNLLEAAGAFSKTMKALKKSTQKWKKKAHTRITEVIAFPVASWLIVLESQRISTIKKYVHILKLNSTILGSWSSNRLFKLCDSGVLHTLTNVGDTLFTQNDALSKKPSAFLVLTGEVRIQIRFTLKEAQKLAPKDVDYFCPPAYHKRTVTSIISIVKSGDCLRAISIVDEVWNNNSSTTKPDKIDAAEKDSATNDPSNWSDQSDLSDLSDLSNISDCSDSGISDFESDQEIDSDQEMNDINLLDPEEQVWRKIFIVMQKAMIKPIQLFRDIDMDDSGLISPNELRDGLLNIIDMKVTDDEFKNIVNKVDRDASGEIDYKELAHCIKYGDPNRIRSMEEQQAKLLALQKKTDTTISKTTKRKEKLAALKKRKKLKKERRLKRKTKKSQVPICEAVAETSNTSILEIHKDSEAASLLRRTGMAKKLLEVDIATFNRKSLIREWVRQKHSTQHLKNGLEETMGPRAKHRREKERRDNLLAMTTVKMNRLRRSKSMSPQKRMNQSYSSPSLLPKIPPMPQTSPMPSKKNTLSSRQLSVVSDVKPYQSRNQVRRFHKVVNDIRLTVPTMNFNPVVLWEKDRLKNGELVMKVITKGDDGKLVFNLYPTEIGKEKESDVHRYIMEKGGYNALELDNNREAEREQERSNARAKQRSDKKKRREDRNL